MCFSTSVKDFYLMARIEGLVALQCDGVQKIGRRSMADLWQLVLITSLTNGLKRSTTPLVLGFTGLVRRSSTPNSQHGLSNFWCPRGWSSRTTKSISVKLLILPVNRFAMVIGQALCRVNKITPLTKSLLV